MINSSANPNPQVEEIRRSIQASYTELLHLLDGPLAQSNSAILYQVSGNDEWTIMQNLAHVVEFMSYWASEAEKLVATPGQNFGRTAQHEGRLRAVSEHKTDSLDQMRAALPGSYARLETMLSQLQDSDLALTGYHPKYGEKSLTWFIQEFITQHLSDHVVQIKACLAAEQK